MRKKKEEKNEKIVPIQSSPRFTVLENCHAMYFFVIKTSDALKMIYFSPNTAKSRVYQYQSQLCYSQTAHLGNHNNQLQNHRRQTFSTRLSLWHFFHRCQLMSLFTIGSNEVLENLR